jgi:hypothetical protein
MVAFGASRAATVRITMVLEMSTTLPAQHDCFESEFFFILFFFLRYPSTNCC